MSARKLVVRQHGVNADTITVELPLTITVDVPAWELTYGTSDGQTADDVTKHLPAVVREAVGEALARLGVGATLQDVP